MGVAEAAIKVQLGLPNPSKEGLSNRINPLAIGVAPAKVVLP